jgi:hypothetical protein
LGYIPRCESVLRAERENLKLFEVASENIKESYKKVFEKVVEIKKK